MAAPPPAGTATARKVATSRSAPVRSAPRRAPLRVVPSERRQGGRGARQGRFVRDRVLMGLSIVLVVSALVVVVAGQAMLANGQVRMTAIQHQLTLEQTTHRQNELQVARLETPRRIVSVATGRLGMVNGPVTELSYVPLNVPLATPKITPAPPSPSTAGPSSPSTTASTP